MNYNLDIGPNIAGIGKLWIFASYFTHPALALLELVIVLIAGFMAYARWQTLRSAFIVAGVVLLFLNVVFQ